MPDVISGQFEWDSEKNKTNQEKHGIAFEDTKNVFDEPYLKLRCADHGALDRARIRRRPFERSSTRSGKSAYA